METRIKASQLMFILLTHLEETSVISQHSEAFINLLILGSKDGEKVVVENVRNYFHSLHKTFLPLMTAIFSRLVMAHSDLCKTQWDREFSNALCFSNA